MKLEDFIKARKLVSTKTMDQIIDLINDIEDQLTQNGDYLKYSSIEYLNSWLELNGKSIIL